MEITFQKDGFIGIFDNVFEKEYLDDIVKFFNKKDEFNFVEHTSKRNAKKHDRDMDELYLGDAQTIHKVPEMFTHHFYSRLWDDIMPVYKKEFSILTAIDLQGEQLKMKRVKPGGGFHTWHYESSGKNITRQLVVQLYINDIDEAGETEFLYQNKRIAPKRNRMLIWPADWTHTHRGNPPIGDKDKYILTTWLEEKLKGN